MCTFYQVDIALKIHNQPYDYVNIKMSYMYLIVITWSSLFLTWPCWCMLYLPKVDICHILRVSHDYVIMI